jgi:hypothetical protein
MIGNWVITTPDIFVFSLTLSSKVNSTSVVDLTGLTLKHLSFHSPMYLSVSECFGLVRCANHLSVALLFLITPESCPLKESAPAQCILHDLH